MMGIPVLRIHALRRRTWIALFAGALIFVLGAAAAVVMLT